MPALNQKSFRGRNDDGGESSSGASWKAAVNANWTQSVDQNFRIRFLIMANAREMDMVFQLQYNRNAAGWNDVSASSLVVRSAASAQFVEQASTTKQLSVAQTLLFITPNAGLDEVDGISCEGGLVDFLAVDYEVELEFCCQLRSADVTNGDAIQLRVIAGESGFAKSALDTYTSMPSMTVATGVLLASAFEMLSIAESAEVRSLLAPSIFDSISAAEFVNPYLLLAPSVFDVVAIAESLTVPPLKIAINLSDSILFEDRILTAGQGYLQLEVFDAIKNVEYVEPNPDRRAIYQAKTHA